MGETETGRPEEVEGVAKIEKVHGSRAPLIVRRYPALHMTWQIGVFLVGVAIIVAGLAMLVLPGPGWVAIFLGLAVLGTEFVWAQRVLRWTKRQAQKAAGKALDPRVRRRNTIVLVVGLVLIAAGVGIYVQQMGLRMPW
ncbi:TIGR02611 family protein [Streptomyces sp. NPDC059637]|uniref:TIGR02611 family protein n=1 Tax=Streptomyces TaxID=1883 RepID=UPI0031CF6F1E